MEERFTATTSRDGRGAVIVLQGTVDRSAQDGLMAAYEQAMPSAEPVLFDFRQVDYINSTGIAVIVGILARARAEGREVGAFGLTDHYREVFTITRLADFMTIYDDAAAATATN